MNATLYLLDTSILLLLVRGGPIARYIRVMYQLDAVVQRSLVCVVSQGEMRAMAARREWGETKRARLLDAFRAYVTVDVNDEQIWDAYVEADRVSRAAPKGARTIGDNDRWIAAAAKASSAVLLTADQDFLHFSRAGFCPVEFVDQASRLLNDDQGS